MTFLLRLVTSRGSRSSYLIQIISSLDLAQDLVYNASSGRKRVHKHVQLGFRVKRKYGSVYLIRWLNRLGTQFYTTKLISPKLSLLKTRSSGESLESLLLTTLNQLCNFRTFAQYWTHIQRHAPCYQRNNYSKMLADHQQWYQH